MRIQFNEFLKNNFLQSSTNLLSHNPPILLFENRQGKNIYGIERITQDHPLIRFVTEKIKKFGGALSYYPLSACQVNFIHPSIPSGIYVYSVARWSLTGARDFERLEYIVKRMGSDIYVEGDIAELLVNAAALKGKDWLGVEGEIDLNQVALIQDNCRAELEENFYKFRDSYQREDIDRIEQMIRGLEVHLNRKRINLNTRINTINITNDQKRMRILPALRGQLNKEELKVSQKIAELKLKGELKSEDSLVSSGLILVN